ncbi:Hsp70 protein-domain-containing protein [Scheffersomyces amazonensis]|uniref:Hsp70 protein-domain-containing protein n=1 Tax=Scheffersomyces amazonensis TaxID=1078765 RepID=UPI00315CDBF4
MRLKTSSILLLLVPLFSLVSSAILGLDFGEKFTKAVLLAPGVPFELVLTDEGKRKDLSGISIKSNGNNNKIERVYGSQTGSLCTRFPQTCLLDIKSLLGKSIEDPQVQEYAHQHPGLKLVSDNTRSNSIKFDLGYDNDSYIFTVEEIVAMGLAEIKARAISDLESNPTALPIAEDVVVSIPAFASPATRQAYLDSLQLAGFSNILGLVDDGSAIALNYVSNKKLQKSDYTGIKEYHIVYDMGAGSTRATLFSFTPLKNGTIIVELESIGYDESFGGRKLTSSIHDVLTEKFLELFKLQHTDITPKISARLFEAAEKAKIILSANNDYRISLESIYDDRDFKTSISREEFEEINSDLVSKITDPIITAIEDASIPLKDIKSIILHGGSTRIPFVQKHLTTLVGEDRISKSVNADESCALGTTLKGLRLKTKFTKSTEIELIEKSYHNYEINVNDSRKEGVVYAKGARISEPTKIELGKISNSNSIDIGLYEDDKLIKSYQFEDLSLKAKKLNCKSKEEIVIFGTFAIDNNKLFDLTKVELECVSKKQKSSGGFFDKFLKKDSEEKVEEEEEEEVEELVEPQIDVNDTSNATNKTSSSKTKKSSIRLSIPVTVTIPKPTYTGIKPISKTTKERLLSKLKFLDEQDEIAIKLEHVKNLLEGQCYELRNHIESNEDILLEELSSVDLIDFRSTISDFIEWLEFESDNASVEDVLEKITHINEAKKKLDSIISLVNTDLSYESFKDLHSKASDLMLKVEELTLELAAEVEQIKEKFSKEGFDYTKESSKVKTHSIGNGKDNLLNLSQIIPDYKTVVEEVADLVASEKAYKSHNKQKLYEFYQSLVNGIHSIEQGIENILSHHKESQELLSDRLEKLVYRRVQQEYRKKLKELEKAEAEEKAAEAKQAESEDPEIEIEEEDEEEEQQQQEQQQEEEETESPEVEVEVEAENENDSEIEHDEL